MNRNVFGWDLPAGAANDPNAPYNQEELPDQCPICGENNVDENGEWLFEEEPPFCSDLCRTKYEIREEEKNGAM